jgi:hypothetical protein
MNMNMVHAESLFCMDVTGLIKSLNVFTTVRVSVLFPSDGIRFGIVNKLHVHPTPAEYFATLSTLPIRTVTRFLKILINAGQYSYINVV